MQLTFTNNADEQVTLDNVTIARGDVDNDFQVELDQRPEYVGAIIVNTGGRYVGSVIHHGPRGVRLIGRNAKFIN